MAGLDRQNHVSCMTNGCLDVVKLIDEVNKQLVDKDEVISPIRLDTFVLHMLYKTIHSLLQAVSVRLRRASPLKLSLLQLSMINTGTGPME